MMHSSKFLLPYPLQFVIVLLLFHHQLHNGAHHCKAHDISAEEDQSYYMLDGMDDETVSIQDSAYFNFQKESSLSSNIMNEYLTPEQNEYFLSSSRNDNGVASNELGLQLPCQPRHVHLSLGDQSQDTMLKKNEEDTAAIQFANMTISFSIPSNSTLNQCSPEFLKVSIFYQKVGSADQDAINDPSDNNVDNAGEEKQTSFVLDHGTFVYNESDDNNGIGSAKSTSVVNQYTSKSPLTNQTYISDYIYHVQLDELERDSIYSYYIQVETNHEKLKQYINERRNIDLYRGFPLHSSTKTLTNTFDIKNSFINTERTLYHGLRMKQKTFKNLDINSSRDSTNYYYNNDDDDDDDDLNNIIGETPKFSFKTPPSTIAWSSSTKTSKPLPTKFAIVGDLGQTYNSSITMANILAETKPESNTTTPVSALLIAGDMSYANTIDPQWNTWFDLIEPLISKTPLMVAPGNHEIECDILTHKPFLPYENRFRMPNRLKPIADVGLIEEKYFHMQWGCVASSQFRIKYDYGNAYYSFVYGQIKTIVLSSYSETHVGSVQYEWLENELKNKVDRSITPWVIVVMHTQFFTTFKFHDKEFQTIDMRRSMEPLFYKYGVNLVFSGHDHAYMRSKPMYNWKVDKKGPVYLIVGEGGNREHHVKEYLHDVAEDWVDVRDKTVYGFGTLEVVNQTHAQWKWIMDANDDGVSFNDDFWFLNQYYD